jgi:hypothetical protein
MYMITTKDKAGKKKMALWRVGEVTVEYIIEAKVRVKDSPDERLVWAA